ncbi:hypothetical protein LCGC14_1565350 [marine sediment metagenome]|uniref:Uncharacterized protein n=1 Tax=marine sediment metagenome TaxID=412755 RepID=A0A0F9IL77_9ZZZZ
MKKTRNYSFKTSKRLPEERMTQVNGIKIPSMPGSCYHAIICALAESKDQFVMWSRIIARTEKYMVMYGGYEVWENFKSKSKVKPYSQRIKDNAHTLTRRRKDCYGYRLHERGMGIYFFKDGAMLLVNGEFKKTKDSYNVKFPNGRKLQVRHRGTTMTSKEYRRFLDSGFITSSGEILNHQAIKDFRAKVSTAKEAPPVLTTPERVKITVTLDENYNQDTARRLEVIGLIVTDSRDNEIDGTLDANKVDEIMSDHDVLGIDILATLVS